tara:strand:+ start:857 stop:1567 length:711 start_codon:yes stop_codon:yes gene_type:complete
MKIIKFYSPNFVKKKRPYNSIKVLVIHYTGMQSERESINRLRNKNSEVSSHFLITQNGKVYRLVDDNRIAWHAGKSHWGKYKNLNKNSIGIELVNKGHKFGYTNFKKKQLLSLITVCKQLIKKYKIKKRNIVGHSDIAPSRKIDPGEKFPWKELANKKIGIWHNCKMDALKKFRKVNATSNDKIKFSKYIYRMGYRYSLKKHKVIKAFQRHFRKELINGIIDKECLVIAQNLSKKH